MAGGKYAGILRNREKMKDPMTAFDLEVDPSTRNFILNCVSDISFTPIIERLLAEIERREFIELHCINLESLFRSRLLSLLREACTENGMFHVIGHGIPYDLLEDMHRLASVFFSLPAKEKLQCSSSTSPWGNRKIQYNKAANGETLEINYDPSLLNRMDWPTEPAIFSKVMARYLVHHEELCIKLLHLLSASLGLADIGLFSACFESFTSVTIRHYSPAPCSILPTTVDEGTHSSVLTMTFPDYTGGLQIFRAGRWRDVKPCEGAILISVGDQLRILSDGKYKSSLHRVVASRYAGRMYIDLSFCASKEFIADLEQLTPSYNPDF